MTVELLELRLDEPSCAAGADAVVVEFDEPVALLAAQVIASTWTGEATLLLGTRDEPRRFSALAITAGRRVDVTHAQPDAHRLVGDPVGEIVARIEGQPRLAGRGHASVRVLVGTPRVVEAAA